MPLGTEARLPLSYKVHPWWRAASVWAFVATLSLLPGLRAETPEEQAVLAPLQEVFDGIAKHDKALVRQQLLPGGTATLLRNGQIVQLHFDAFVERLPGGTQRLEERIHDPLVRIDNDIAVIRAPYEFLIEGKLDHCGTDLVHLVHRDGRWLIAGIGDNSRSCKP